MLGGLGRSLAGTWAIAASITVLLSSACAKPNFVVAPSAPVPQARPDARLTDTVVIVSIDGLRPDAIGAFKAPTLTRLLAEGSFTLSARTILPSKTLPSHTSMLTGEPPERHGILWNNAYDDAPGEIAIPTVFEEARARGYRTAAFFSKSKFSHLQKPGTLDYSQAPGGWFGRWSSSHTLDDVERYLESSKPNLLFVHLPDPDVDGHASGWMSESYGRGVLKADRALARLMAASSAAFGAGQYTLIVTADHGGHGTDHGDDNPLDVNIPWIAWGRGVSPGELRPSTVKTMDTAATALYLLGVRVPEAWAGRPVLNAFKAPVTDPPEPR
ncbi:MAG: alkaline phosphatase family protein [Acidobacteriota bacterium]